MNNYHILSRFQGSLRISDESTCFVNFISETKCIILNREHTSARVNALSLFISSDVIITGNHFYCGFRLNLGLGKYPWCSDTASITLGRLVLCAGSRKSTPMWKAAMLLCWISMKRKESTCQASDSCSIRTCDKWSFYANPSSYM